MAVVPAPGTPLDVPRQNIRPQNFDERLPDLHTVLIIRHLPEAIPHDTLSRLFSHYGAHSVRPCHSGRLRNCAFVDFSNETAALNAHRQLHGLRLLGKVLSVEKATSSERAKIQQEKRLPVPKFKGSNLLQDKCSAKCHHESGVSKEPICSRLCVDYPFPPSLQYAYPPPNGHILTNIVNSLIAVPRFYTQVLHLMNKMNLPAPFQAALPTPPLPPPPPAVVPFCPPPSPPPVPLEPCSLGTSSEESELESSDGESDRGKRAKITPIVGPGINRNVDHVDVGLRPAALVPKEIPVIRKKNAVLQIKIGQREGRKRYNDEVAVEESGCPTEEASGPDYLTPEELRKGKLPPEEILSLPMFKNYATGSPTPVLYIKNLAKDVVSKDFFFIFGSLFETMETTLCGLSVKLMQEGRMRGQAFVTFPSVELAASALNLVNGYVFKGKPMIIQFGRTPPASK